MPRLTLILTVIAAALFGLGINPSQLAFIPELASNGEGWRTLTGHLVHLSFDHVLWDALTLLALGCYAERNWRKRYYGCLLSAALLIPWGIHWFDPGLDLYAGLSGIDCALFAFVFGSLLHERWTEYSRPKRAALLIFGMSLLAKIAYESITGQTLFVASNTDFEVVPMAHFIGGCLGVLWAVLPGLRSSKTMTRLPRLSWRW